VVQLASYGNYRRMPIASPRHAYTPALVSLGAAIRMARRAQGVSQEELADRAQLDRSYMGSIERGAQNPGIVSILRIASALQMTASELFARAEL
jgi:transcriptional regulator with XRE-family HTH domain